MIELERWTATAEWPPVLTVSIGHLAERGFAALTLPGATGAGADLIRKLALAAHEEKALAGIAEDFFPRQRRTDIFIPEPGCSSATFRGSAAEVQALAANLFAGALSDLSRAGERAAPVMSARVVQLSNASGRFTLGSTAELSWDPDIVLDDMAAEAGEPHYQIRISRTALESMRTEALRTRDCTDPLVETGGTLFGQVDTAARVVWVTEATGPAQDSVQQQAEFVYGTSGVSNLRDLLRQFSVGRLRFIGMWHTHPHGGAGPSERDKQTMLRPEESVNEMPPRSLMIILAGPNGQWDRWLSDGSEPQIFAGLMKRSLQLGSAAPGPQ
jgi:integrative and conjugative element protein (TIGR02256 family)